MRTLHLKLRKGNNTTKLQQTSLNTMEMDLIKILSCHIAWSLQNIRENVNDTLVKDSTTLTLPPGYYTFSSLKTLLASHQITLEKNANNTIVIEAKVDLNLKQLGSSLLGFTPNQAIVKNTKTTSAKPASFTNGIKDIHIHCPSLVNPDENISKYLSGVYARSSLLVSLFVDTNASNLNGTFREYTLNYLALPCRDFIGSELNILVESGGHAEDYEIYIVLGLE